ncbi:MAG: hypothetical protein ABSG91_19270 [Syntrophobacteraceae bacterium]
MILKSLARAITARLLARTALAFALVLPFASSASAITTVTIEGTTVVIHVPIEVAGLTSKMSATLADGTKTNAGDYLQQGAMKIWNDALAGFKFECLSFRLDLQLIPVAWEAPHQAGRHRVQFEIGDPPENCPPEMLERWRANVWDPTGSDDTVPNLDNPFPFTRDVNGHWFQPSADVVAHEVGHVLGLGDDYFRTANPDGTSSVTGYKPEAGGITYDAGGKGTGTFTTSGIGIPDPTAVARVILQMKAAGILPQCWKGTLNAEAVFSFPENGPAGNWLKCTDAWAVETTVITSSDGTLSGAAMARRTAQVKCDRPAPVTMVSAMGFRIEGKHEATALHLRFVSDGVHEPPGGIDMTGFSALLGGIGDPKIIDLPIIGKNEASGPVNLAWVMRSNRRNASGHLVLECAAC